MNHSSDNWLLKSNKASLVSAQFGASVELLKPDAGLQIDGIGDAPVAGNRILGYTHLPTVDRKMVEQYVRGEDLVATYTTDSGDAENLQYRDQVYWRYFQVAGNDFVDGVELLASLQTDLLDLSPRVQFSTVLESGEVFAMTGASGDAVQLQPIRESQTIDGDAAAAFVFKSEAGWSYLQSLHQTDCNSCEKTDIELVGDEVMVTTTLHFDHLEKGVIRRIRVRGGISATGDLSPQEIGKWFDAFSRSELPLTV